MLDCTFFLHKFDLVSDQLGDFTSFLDSFMLCVSHDCGLLSLLIIN